MNKELKPKIELVLATVYAKADWSALNIKRSAYDFFTDKIEVSTSEPDFLLFLGKLKTKMQVKNWNIDTNVLEELQERSNEVMVELRKYTKSWYGLKGALDGKKLKESWKTGEVE